MIRSGIKILGDCFVLGFSGGRHLNKDLHAVVYLGGNFGEHWWRHREMNEAGKQRKPIQCMDEGLLL
jgi:hypothetical protein